VKTLFLLSAILVKHFCKVLFLETNEIIFEQIFLALPKLFFSYGYEIGYDVKVSRSFYHRKKVLRKQAGSL